MTVKNLITQLLDLPMDSQVDVCTKDEDGKCTFKPAFHVYSEDNGTIVISSR